MGLFWIRSRFTRLIPRGDMLGRVLRLFLATCAVLTNGSPPVFDKAQAVARARKTTSETLTTSVSSSATTSSLANGAHSHIPFESGYVSTSRLAYRWHHCHSANPPCAPCTTTSASIVIATPGTCCQDKQHSAGPHGPTSCLIYPRAQPSEPRTDRRKRGRNKRRH